MAAHFALSPALVNEDVIDYATAEGSSIFKQAVKPLKVEFDCTPEGLTVFLNQIKDRAIAFGWNPILEVPIDVDDDDEDAETINICEGYGQLTLEQVRAHVETYINEEVREAQLSMQLYQCITKSLTEAGQAKVMLSHSDYIVDGSPSGVALIKVIVRISYVDTNATVLTIRNNLSTLDTCMVTMDSNVEKFNDYVKTQMEALAARGETTNDIIANLFKGYKAASDDKFYKFIERKEESYEEGNDITHEQLMQQALNKYSSLVEKGLWKAPTESEERIIALEAELKQVKAAARKSNKKRRSQREKASKTSEKEKKPDWMSIEPKEGAPKTKTVNKKLYHWCPAHKSWVRHAPKDCKKAKASEKSNKDKDKNIRVERALTSVLQEEDSDDSDFE